MFNLPLEVEHIVPPRQGGDDTDANLALSCRACNLFKSDHLDAVDLQTGATVRLFNPRVDRWEEHVCVTADGLFDGISPIGRAMVSRLKLNLPTQVAARHVWMRLGLFP